MKSHITNYLRLQLPLAALGNEGNSVRSLHTGRAQAIRKRGVALVVTLLMLSLITFIAVTFLLLARRERNQSAQSVSLTEAQLAAQVGVERALGEIMAAMVAGNTMNETRVFVSTNIDVPANPLLAVDWVGLTNDGRAPVFRELDGPMGRFYFDWNRNGTNDSVTTNGLGDPEWIGMLKFPDQPHSGDNRFLYRYCFAALPEGNMLDINTIYNHTRNVPNPLNNDGFVRNQGWGSPEINLAAFLATLNPNVWTYISYVWNDLAQPNQGIAFEDANTLLMYRYGKNLTAFPTPYDIFGANAIAFTLDRFDTYLNGPIQSSPWLANLDTTGTDDPNQPWQAAPSTNRFFTPSDYFDPTKTGTNFVNRLLSVSSMLDGTNNYAFYELITQLGTDTSPLRQTNLININYDNVSSNAAPLQPWDPTTFFMVTAGRLMSERSNVFRDPLSGQPFTVSNIMIYPTNLYSQEVHQLLQLVANIYDAATNVPNTVPEYPTVFRPVFTNITNITNTNSVEIYIVGYREEPGTDVLKAPMRDLNVDTERAALRPDDMVWGIPLIIGARKGYPNFNEFSLQTYVQVSRKLELRRPSTNAPPNETNQMYILGISNVFGVECWNAYTSAFPRPLYLYATNIMYMSLLDIEGRVQINRSNTYAYATNMPGGAWGPGRMIIPFMATNIFNLGNKAGTNFAYFSTRMPPFEPVEPNPGFDRGAGYPMPRWMLYVSNKFNYVLVDTSVGRIVDYVNCDGFRTTLDISRELVAHNDVGEPSPVGSMWITDRNGGSTSITDPPIGIINQISVSLGDIAVSDADWRNYSQRPQDGMDKPRSQDAFRRFVRPGTGAAVPGLTHQAPFTPTRKLYHYTSWQANDPLVHYTVWDLMDGTRPTNVVQILNPPTMIVTNNNLGQLNDRYSPWGGNPRKDPSLDPTAYNRMIKDAGVRKADDWDFPRSKFPSLGWLGRVHRGTPWQTIYLKPEVADANLWVRWAGNIHTHPTNDWRLVDIFTTHFYANSTRGLMPINQTGLASWAATLSGILVLTNSGSNTMQLDPIPIEPNSPSLLALVDAINRERAQQPQGRFTKLSQLLAIPELTIQSPFLDLSPQQQQRGLNDIAYETLPEKLLSLLRLPLQLEDSRYVIYAWGQSLRPAPDSIVVRGTSPNSPVFKLCTNYHVAGEVAVRAVVRFENADTNAAVVRPRAIIESFNLLPPD